MGQRVLSTPAGKARASRHFARMRRPRTVNQTGQSASFASRWLAPIVICVVEGRDSWSEYLDRAIRRPDWTVTKLARLSGLSRTTIYKWIEEGASAITIDSVYRIADALGDDRATALAAAGNLPPERDEEVDLILASSYSEREKVQMIDRLMRRREEEKARRLEDLKFVLGDAAENTERQAG